MRQFKPKTAEFDTARETLKSLSEQVKIVDVNVVIAIKVAIELGRIGHALVVG